MCHGSFDASALDSQQFFHSYNKHLSAYHVAGTVAGAVSTVGNSTDDTPVCARGADVLVGGTEICCGPWVSS